MGNPGNHHRSDEDCGGQQQGLPVLQERSHLRFPPSKLLTKQHAKG
jgi:hypothetical protein